MSQIIKCPSCDMRSWSSDYWTCPSCGYSESREWVLLEENKDYKEGRNKGDEPKLDLGFWIEEQGKLAQKIADHVLPSQRVKVEVVPILTSSQGKECWGIAQYWTPQRKQANFLVDKWVSYYYSNEIKPNNPYLITFKREVFHDHFSRTEPNNIKISHKTLTTEYSPNTKYGPRGAGFLPTTTHEVAHVSNKVKQNPKHQPWIKEGHDEVWENEAINFHDEAERKFGEEVKKRFKEYRKISNKEEDKYD